LHAEPEPRRDRQQAHALGDERPRIHVRLGGLAMGRGRRKFPRRPERAAIAHCPTIEP
jgi:hypothetical protein